MKKQIQLGVGKGQIKSSQSRRREREEKKKIKTWRKARHPADMLCLAMAMGWDGLQQIGGSSDGNGDGNNRQTCTHTQTHTHTEREKLQRKLATAIDLRSHVGEKWVMGRRVEECGGHADAFHWRASLLFQDGPPKSRRPQSPSPRSP